jgi:hypothetical protein
MRTVLQRDNMIRVFRKPKHATSISMLGWLASLVDERDALLDTLGQLFLCLLQTSSA